MTKQTMPVKEARRLFKITLDNLATLGSVAPDELKNHPEYKNKRDQQQIDKLKKWEEEGGYRPGTLGSITPKPDEVLKLAEEYYKFLYQNIDYIQYNQIDESGEEVIIKRKKGTAEPPERTLRILAYEANHFIERWVIGQDAFFASLTKIRTFPYSWEFQGFQTNKNQIEIFEHKQAAEKKKEDRPERYILANNDFTLSEKKALTTISNILHKGLKANNTLIAQYVEPFDRYAVKVHMKELYEAFGVKQITTSRGTKEFSGKGRKEAREALKQLGYKRVITTRKTKRGTRKVYNSPLLSEVNKEVEVTEGELKKIEIEIKEQNPHLPEEELKKLYAKRCIEYYDNKFFTQGELNCMVDPIIAEAIVNPGKGKAFFIPENFHHSFNDSCDKLKVNHRARTYAYDLARWLVGRPADREVNITNLVENIMHLEERVKNRGRSEAMITIDQGFKVAKEMGLISSYRKVKGKDGEKYTFKLGPGHPRYKSE